MAWFDDEEIEGDPPPLSSIIFVSAVMAVAAGCFGFFAAPRPHFSMLALIYTAGLIGALFLLAKDFVYRFLSLYGFMAQVERDAEYRQPDVDYATRQIYWLPMTIFAVVWFGGSLLICRFL